MLLELSGITKQFPGVIANDKVSFTLRAGEVHALVGENGAGKTTLMKILYGLHRPDAGTISVDDAPIAIRGPRDAIRRGIGMVHQHFMLFPPFSVLENIIIGEESQTAGVLALGPPAQADPRSDGGKRHFPRPGLPGRGPSRGSAAAGGNPEDPLPRGAHPHLRRADGGAHAAGVRGAFPHVQRPEEPRQGDHLHHAQAGRGAGRGGPHHRDPPGKSHQDDGPRGGDKADDRRAHGREAGAHGGRAQAAGTGEDRPGGARAVGAQRPRHLARWTVFPSPCTRGRSTALPVSRATARASWCCIAEGTDIEAGRHPPGRDQHSPLERPQEAGGGHCPYSRRTARSTGCSSPSPWRRISPSAGTTSRPSPRGCS